MKSLAFSAAILTGVLSICCASAGEPCGCCVDTWALHSNNCFDHVWDGYCCERHSFFGCDLHFGSACGHAAACGCGCGSNGAASSGCGCAANQDAPTTEAAPLPVEPNSPSDQPAPSNATPSNAVPTPAVRPTPMAAPAKAATFFGRPRYQVQPAGFSR
ncbi:MAG TPA: hypothetical protein VFE24_18320 [Pirellulales bacterium]|jgi:hypothetical protein|nr:hypothetical protein [Pirellulales bacterium]